MILSILATFVLPDPPLYGCVVQIDKSAWAIGPKRKVALVRDSPLKAQDRVQLSPGGSVVVMRFSDCRRVKLAFDARRNPVVLPSKAGPVSALKRMFQSLGVPGLDHHQYIKGAVRPGDAPPVDCAPVFPRGALLQAPVEFRWVGAAPKGAAYTIGSLNDERIRRKFEVPEGATTFQWPAGEPAFLPNCRYIWRVQSEGSKGEIANFSLVDEARNRRVKVDLAQVDGSPDLEPDERILVKVQVLQKHGLFADSITLLDTLGEGIHPSIAALLRNQAWSSLGVADKALRTDLSSDDLVRQWQGLSKS